MKLQRQTIFRDVETGVRGNCLATCIACMLNLDVADVPNFAQSETGFDDATSWLAERGIALVYFDGGANDATMIAYGMTVRGTRHAVLWRNGKLLHDPHPSDAGIIAVEELWMLSIDDISKLLASQARA